MLTNALHQLIIDEWDRSIGPHPTGIRSGVAFADSFVVLSREHRPAVFTVGEGHNRHLTTGNKFFDDNPGSRFAKHLAGH